MAQYWLLQITNFSISIQEPDDPNSKPEQIFENSIENKSNELKQLNEQIEENKKLKKIQR